MNENMACRQWATRGDKQIDGPARTGPHDLSPDAIGGAYGIYWYEYFEDQETGERYMVRCFDGTNRSKGAYEDE